MRVHRALGPGFLESVYQKALAHELRKIGLRADCEHPVRVTYDGMVVGEFVSDILVDSRVMIENKAVTRLTTAHEVQLVNYLVATGVEIGLLINFGAESLQFKRRVRSFDKDGDCIHPSAGHRSPFGRRNPVNPVNPVQ